MATKIVTKNSSTASAVPTASDLVQGELAVNVADKRLFTEDNAGAIVELGTNPSGNVTFQDNGKAIFGAGSDLQIYHDGSNSFIADVGTGNLGIRAENLFLQNADGSENYATATVNGAFTLSYDNSQKLATTSTGIDVTGTATMDGLSVANSTTNAYKAAIVESAHPTTDAGLLFIGGGDYEFGLQQPYNAAGLFFYDRTNNVERMRIDSAGRVGIGTSSPSDELHVKSPDPFVTVESNSTGNNGFRANNDSGNFYFGIDNAGGNFYGSAYARAIYADGAYPVTFYTNAAERMRIDSDGDMIMKGGRIKVRENDDGNDAVVITRDADEGYVNLYSSGSQTVEIRGNGDSYFNGGDVGIGTSSPSEKLHVVGGNIKTDSSTRQIGYWEADAVHDGYFVPYNASGQSELVNSFTTGGLIFKTGTSKAERMRIDSAGNVGIGTTPATGVRLDIRSNAAATIGDFRNASATGFGLYVAAGDTSSQYAFRAADYQNNLLFTVQGDGNVGIGTSSPSNKLHVHNTAGDSFIRMSGGGSLGENYGGFVRGWGVSGSGGNLDLGVIDNNAFRTAINVQAQGNEVRFSTAGTERMRIDTNGKIFMNEGVPFAWTDGSLNVSADIYGDSSDNLVFRNTSAKAERMRIDSSGNLLVGTTSTLRSNKFHASSSNFVGGFNVTNGTGEAVAFFSNGTVVGTISVTGSTTTYNTSSDQRLKENIADADDAGSKIDAIQVRKYDWKADGSHQDYGMIAQELQAVAPEAVSGDADSEEMMGVDYSKLVPMLIKEIQSLRNRVAQLEE